MIGRFLLLFTLAAAVARPLAAQEPTPGQIRAAERLVAAMHLESSWGPMQEQMIRQFQPAATDTSRYGAELARQLRETFAQKLTWQRVGPEYVKLYASLYTEDELRQLTAFYESPVGQKSIRINSQATAKTFEMVQRLIAQPTP